MAATVSSLLRKASRRVSISKNQVDFVVKLKKAKVGNNQVENFLKGLGVALQKREGLDLQEKYVLLNVVLNLKLSDAEAQARKNWKEFNRERFKLEMQWGKNSRKMRALRKTLKE